MSTQQEFLSNIKEALGRTPGQRGEDIFTTSPTAEEQAVIERIKSRTPQERAVD